ncbi:DUF4249 domain-containing protein [Putridiphycobacter roseus]|nr:DUF4249 domain-containing protein [Putridiphycobacter roseus]
MKINLYILICVSLFASCQKEIKIDQEKIKNKIVVNGIISTQLDTVWIGLTESRDLLYDKFYFPVAKNAKVELFEDGVPIGVLSFLNEQYFLAYKVIAGKTYKLEASYKDFTPITAQTTVPYPGTVESFTVSKNENQRIYAAISLKDNVQEDNFYGIQMFRKEISLDTFNQLGDSYQTYSCTNEFITTYPKPDVSVGNTCASEFLLKDTPFENSTYTFNLFADSYVYGIDNLQTEVIISLKSYNYDYYQYLISRYVYNNNFGNPFAEPVQVYNNIENGFGIFGASFTASDTIIID